MTIVRRISRFAAIIASAMLTVINLYKLVLPIQSVQLIKQLTSFVNRMLQKYTFIGKSLGIFVFALCIILLLNVVLEMISDQKTHTFKVGSRRFNSFFSRWYSKKGSLFIICDDLEEWVTPEIKRAIINKAQENALHIFLTRLKPEDIVEEIRGKGGVVCEANNNIASQYSLSCMTYMGNTSTAIIRDKNKDKSERIKFEEMPHSYSTSLLHELINMMQERQEK